VTTDSDATDLKDLRIKVERMHAVLIGNGVDGIIHRLEDALDRLDECRQRQEDRLGLIEGRVNDHLTRDDERNKIIAKLLAAASALGLSGVASGIAALFKQ
jgi:hypothetical protein